MGAKDTTDQPEEPGIGLIDQWLASHVAAAGGAADNAPDEPPTSAAEPDPLPPITSAKSRLAAARRAEAADNDLPVALEAEVRRGPSAGDRLARARAGAETVQPEERAPSAAERLAAARRSQVAETAGQGGSEPSAAERISAARRASAEATRAEYRPPSAADRIAEARRASSASDRNVAGLLDDTSSPEPMERPSRLDALRAAREQAGSTDALNAEHWFGDRDAAPAPSEGAEPAPAATESGPVAADAALATSETGSADDVADPEQPDSDERRERLAKMLQRRNAIPDAPAEDTSARPVEVPVPPAPTLDPIATLAEKVGDSTPPTRDAGVDVFAALRDTTSTEATTDAAEPTAGVPAEVEPAEVEPAVTPSAAASTSEVEVETAAQRLRRGKHKADVAPPAPTPEPEALSAAIMEPALQAVLRAVEPTEKDRAKKSRFRRNPEASKQSPASEASPVPMRPPVTEIPPSDGADLLLDPAVARAMQGQSAPAVTPHAGKPVPAEAPAPEPPVEKAPRPVVRPAKKAATTPAEEASAADLLDLVTRSAADARARREVRDEAAKAVDASPPEPPTPITPEPARVVAPELETYDEPPATLAEPPAAEPTAAPERSSKPMTMAARAKAEARKKEAARAALLAEVSGAEVDSTTVPEPRPTSEPTRSDLPDTVHLKPRRSTRQLLGVLMFLAFVGAVGTGLLAWDSRGTTEIAIAGTMALLTLILWSAFSTADPAKLTIERGVLDIVSKDSHYRFDLSSPYTEVVVRGAPGKRNWQVQIARRSMAPYVINASMVDPHEFAPLLEHFRAEAERNATEASKRRSQAG